MWNRPLIYKLPYPVKFHSRELCLIKFNWREQGWKSREQSWISRELREQSWTQVRLNRKLLKMFMWASCQLFHAWYSPNFFTQNWQFSLDFHHNWKKTDRYKIFISIQFRIFHEICTTSERVGGGGLVESPHMLPWDMAKIYLECYTKTNLWIEKKKELWQPTSLSTLCNSKNKNSIILKSINMAYIL